MIVSEQFDSLGQRRQSAEEGEDCYAGGEKRVAQATSHIEAPFGWCAGWRVV
jgi:hypothetical protein